MKPTWLYIFLFAAISVPQIIVAQQRDSLPAVKITAVLPEDESKTRMPLQQLQKNDLNALNSYSVAEATKFLSGILVKDYGGMGGLKTVSIRSLGANHTGIMYDGVMMGDAQAGQADLGKFSLDNVESVKLYNGQPTQDILPARAYASGGVIEINTITSNVNKKLVTAQINAGSFGWLNTSVMAKSGIGEKFHHGMNAEFQRVDGRYPFKNYVAGNADDKRQNTDLVSWRTEYDAGILFNDSNQLQLKLNYYNSERGLPGAVLLYNTYSAERLKNEVFFTQARWKKQFSARSGILMSAKFTKDYKYYIDPDYPNSSGELENEFYQKEFYFSAAYGYTIHPDWKLSYAADYYRSSLHRADTFAQTFADPVRNTVLNNIAIGYEKQLFAASANLLHSFIKENVKNGASGRKLNEFTPAFSMAYRLGMASPFLIRAFYKKIFRAPSFDDLYYTNVGNTNLKPEFATQYNLGLTYSKSGNNVFENVQITADAYYNNVKDRILAVPRQNLFQWSMLNVGETRIKGLDATLQVKFSGIGKWKFSSVVSYTFQDAKDFSNPASTTYKNQLPYTPKHSGAAAMQVLYKQFSLSYNVLLSSYRYRQGEQVFENLLKEWATQDLVASCNISNKNNQYRLTASFNNIFNKQYEIIKYYPMPRFNYRIGLVATFK